MSEHTDNGRQTDWISYTPEERRQYRRNAEDDYLAVAEVELATLREEYFIKARVVSEHRARLMPDAFRIWMHMADEVEVI